MFKALNTTLSKANIKNGFATKAIYLYNQHVMEKKYGSSIVFHQGNDSKTKEGYNDYNHVVEEEGEYDATFHLKLGNIDVARNDNVLCMQEFCEHFFIENVEMEQENNMTMLMQMIKNQLSHKKK